MRSAQQAQDFRCCCALPSLIAQFASKASDVCLLGRGRLGTWCGFQPMRTLGPRCLSAPRFNPIATDFGAPLHWLPRGLRQHPSRSDKSIGSGVSAPKDSGHLSDHSERWDSHVIWLPKRKGTKAGRYPLPGASKPGSEYLRLKGRQSATAPSWPPGSHWTMPVLASPETSCSDVSAALADYDVFVFSRIVFEPGN
jgi:hypothetical protein